MLESHLIGLLVLCPTVVTAQPLLQEGQEKGQVKEAVLDAPVVKTATPEELESLIGFFESAMEKEEAEGVIEALRRMEMHDNEELVKPAIEALKYEASKLDKKAVDLEADTLGITKRSARKEMLIELESKVQAVGARVLSTIPGKKSTSALMKALKSKDVRKERPLTMAAVIAALGTQKYEKAAKLVEDELRQQRDPLIARASVRFFGQIQTKDMDIVRSLIGLLDPPEPANVDDPSNPPASYWAARWETWSHTRRDVTWALKEITGETFNPAEGGKPSDSARATKFVKDNAKRLGLK